MRKTGLSGALVAVVAALCLVGASPASAAPAAKKTSGSCWLQVVNDWLKNDAVEGTYAIPCYRQAIQHLNGYPDIKQYSSAIDDIHRALLVAISQKNDHSGPGGGSNGGGGPIPGGGGGGGGANPSGGGSTPSSGTSGSHKSLFKKLAADIGPGNAQSIPLPLLVLGGLAVLLLLTAAATWLARRLQGRRVTPAPAAVRGGNSVRPKT